MTISAKLLKNKAKALWKLINSWIFLLHGKRLYFPKIGSSGKVSSIDIYWNFLRAQLFINLNKKLQWPHIFIFWHSFEKFEYPNRPLQSYTNTIVVQNYYADRVIPKVCYFCLLISYWPDTWLSPIHTKLCYYFEIIIIYHGSLANYYTCWPHVYQIISLLWNFIQHESLILDHGFPVAFSLLLVHTIPISSGGSLLSKTLYIGALQLEHPLQLWHTYDRSYGILDPLRL